VRKKRSDWIGSSHEKGRGKMVDRSGSMGNFACNSVVRNGASWAHRCWTCHAGSLRQRPESGRRRSGLAVRAHWSNCNTTEPTRRMRVGGVVAGCDMWPSDSARAGISAPASRPTFGVVDPLLGRQFHNGVLAIHPNGPVDAAGVQGEL